MTGNEDVICFLGLVLCLGVCLMRAFWEIERWRQGRRRLVRLTDEAMTSVFSARKRRE
jgi:hypothetical protein